MRQSVACLYATTYAALKGDSVAIVSQRNVATLEDLMRTLDEEFNRNEQIDQNINISSFYADKYDDSKMSVQQFVNDKYSKLLMCPNLVPAAGRNAARRSPKQADERAPRSRRTGQRSSACSHRSDRGCCPRCRFGGTQGRIDLHRVKSIPTHRLRRNADGSKGGRGYNSGSNPTNQLLPYLAASPQELHDRHPLTTRIPDDPPRYRFENRSTGLESKFDSRHSNILQGGVPRGVGGPSGWAMRSSSCVQCL